MQAQNVIYSRVLQGRELIEPCLQYEYATWKQGPYKKIKKVHTDSAVLRGGRVLTGHLDRIEKYCADQGYRLAMDRSKIEKLPSLIPVPFVPGITFRDDQAVTVAEAVQRQRGVMLSATGTGKTWLLMGLLSCFPPQTRTLLLFHTTGLVKQTKTELEAHGFDSHADGIRVCAEGRVDDLGGITLATNQTFIKLPAQQYASLFDIVVVDECHIGTGLETNNGKILQGMLAPVRLGLTATLPTSAEDKLWLEGLLGPVIEGCSIAQGIDLGVLARPRVRIIKIPFRQSVNDLRTYKDVYRAGVVISRARNQLVLDTAAAYVNAGQSVLILINQTEHGAILQRMAQQAYQWSIPFIWGDTDSDTREYYRHALNNKEALCIIASTVWKVGINIPNLNVLINAAGGKTEVPVLQAIGRGMRRTDEKAELVLVDFFDPSHWRLISHFGERFSLFCDEGWI